MRNVTHLYWLHSEPFASPNSLQGNGISQSRPRNFGLDNCHSDDAVTNARQLADLLSGADTSVVSPSG